MKINIVDAHEVWANNIRLGFIVEEWFYPAPGVQLGAIECLQIAEHIQGSKKQEGYETTPPRVNWDFVGVEFERFHGQILATVPIGNANPKCGHIARIDNRLWRIKGVHREDPGHVTLLISEIVPLKKLPEEREVKPQITNEREDRVSRAMRPLLDEDPLLPWD